MGKPATAFLPLVLLASVNIASPLKSDASVFAISEKPEPCALVATAQQEQLSKNKKATTFYIPAELAHACLLSVPFKKENSLQLIDGLGSFWQWQSTLDYLKDPPKSYLLPAIDLDTGLRKIRANAAENKYKNELEFQQDLNSLVKSVHDGHFTLHLDALNIFTFRRSGIGPIVALSSDGDSLPKIYSYRDLKKRNTDWKTSAMKSIDGEDAHQWLKRLSYNGTSQDPDALYNELLFTLPASTLGYFGTFFSATGLYTGNEIEVGFENGTNIKHKNEASFHLDFSDVKDGETFYGKFCSGRVEQAPLLKKRQVELEKKLELESPRPEFPKAVIESDDGIIAGYFLDDEFDTAVLSITSFDPDGEGNNVNLKFSTVVTKFLEKCGKEKKKKLILDVTSNGGGVLFLGFDLFMQLFPQGNVTSTFNLRATEQINVIGRKVNKLLSDSATKNGKTATYERNGIFDINSYVGNNNGQKFESWEAYFGPQINMFNFTRLARWDLNNEIMSLKIGKLTVAGYGSRFKQAPQVFKAEDIILLTDGTCASTCAVLADLLKQQRVRSIMAGGLPRQGLVQAVGGVKGSQVLTFQNVFRSAARVFELYLTPQEQQQLDDTDLGKIYRTGSYVLARTVGDGTGGRINYRNAIHPDDNDRIPRQFAYEPADCRIWHTPETILNPNRFWTLLGSRVWGKGKSSITLRLVRSQWTHELVDLPRYDPTIEDSYSVTRTVDGRPYFLSLTDTAGQEEYRGLWATSNLKSDAFLIVYDITNSSTLDALDYFMDMIDVEAENRIESNERLMKQLSKKNTGKDQIAVGMAPPVTIVAGNKCDLKDARVVSARQGLEWARKRGCGFMETSAREMVNIEETFALIVRRVVEARRIHHLQQFPPSQQPSQPLISRPPPMERTTSQLIAHSHTPPLTAHEQALGDEIYTKKQHGSDWLGLRRAFSKRILKIRKEGDSQTSTTPTQRNQSVAESTKTSRSNQQKNSSALNQINEAVITTQQNRPPASDIDIIRPERDIDTNFPKKPWWKRLDCARP
ncbi:hypothetical protein LOZ66_002323 [Ophidiomyces ophidiicola]|nr:hypothetical protein LOZ66_002323 [Ophidiomyces ophidiicola]